MASGKWMLQTLDKRKEASLIGIQLRVADQNWTYECQFGGTLSFTNDSVENDFKYTYRFSECEDSSEIMEKLFDALFNGEPMAQPEPESNDTIFHYNGTVSEELKECGEESCAYAEELSFNASQFSATTVRSDEDVNGSFGMNLSLWAGAGPDSDDIHYASLQADGCVAIDGTDNDGYLLKANLSFNRLNVDINSTTEIEPLVRQQGKSMAQNHSNEPERVRVNLDGYAGLQGQFREDDESNLTSLDSYQFYAEGVTIDNVYDNDSEDDNLTVSGKFGDACMQGVVTYQGTVGPQWNDKSVPMDGNLSLNDGEATVVFNEENVTFLNNSGGILQTFVGGPDENVSWDDLTDPQCSKIYRDLLDNFFPFQ
ncbi:hypothetical protein [Nitratifractor salsuginis]|nr:hypothetical protein [Nitratifractor salsuginis]